MVILRPIRHVGCSSASSGPTSRSWDFSNEKNGPPDAVSKIPLISSSARPSRHWKIAECSESTGISRPPLARFITQSPPATRDSLFASATRFPASRAPTVAASPAKPTMPLRTTSAGSEASWPAEPGPASTSAGALSKAPASFGDSRAT